MVEKYFVAAKVPLSVKQQIDHLYAHHGNHQEGLSWYSGDFLIVPVRYFGHHSKDMGAARDALHSLHVIHPVTVKLGHHTHTLDNDLVYVPVIGLDEMIKEVRKMTMHMGHDEHHHRFLGRIAIVERNHGSKHTLPHITEAFHGQFVVDNLYLMHSEHNEEHGHVKYKPLDNVHLSHHH